jgi:putative transposase
MARRTGEIEGTWTVFDSLVEPAQPGSFVKTTKAHRIRLHPTPEQEDYLRRACGTRRYVYNWGLAAWQRHYHLYKTQQSSDRPTANALKKQFNAIREVDFPWTYDVTKCVVEGAFDDLDKAFANFFAKRAKYPQFKKKGRSHESFYPSNDKFRVGDHWVQVPLLGDFIVRQREANEEVIAKRAQMKRRLGKINCTEKLRFQGRILGATISYRAGWWFLSVQVEVFEEQRPVEGPPVGIDLGFVRLATLSDDTRFENQKPLRRLLAQVRYLNQQLARRQKGSKHREKTKRQLARLHYRIQCLRDDLLHKISFKVTEHYGFIGLENLHVRGMLRNRHLALSASDAALGRLTRFIERKAARHGTPVQRVDRFFPSTKRCHVCHNIREMEMSERVYVCLNPECSWTGDRDWNAAVNILDEALRLAGAAA